MICTPEGTFSNYFVLCGMIKKVMGKIDFLTHGPHKVSLFLAYSQEDSVPTFEWIVCSGTVYIVLYQERIG